MDALAITQKGIEAVAAMDVKEILGKAAVIHETIVLFDADDSELMEFAYRSQAVNRVLRLIAKSEVNNHLKESMSSVKKALENADLSFISGKTFRANCIRSGSQDYGSQDIATMLGDIIVEHGGKVSLENPEIIILAYIRDETCYVGIDRTGLDLGKRDYRVFTHPSSLSGITAYSILRLAGYDGTQSLLDPFCGVGTIPIEAALYATKTSPNLFRRDHFRDLKCKDRKKTLKKEIKAFDYLLRFIIAAKKNATIASMDKDITVSKVEVEWLDTKVDKASADMIVTHPPSPSKVTGTKEIEKLYKEFLYQCDYVLRKDGTIAVLFQNSSLFRDLLKKDGKWVLSEEHSIWQGNQELCLLIVRRGGHESGL